MTVVDEFARSKYVSLVTYRKSGVAVPTPVWHAVDGGVLYLISEAGAGKVKRIRNNPQVQVTVCDLRGRSKPDAPTAPGTARLLDDAETAEARRRIERRYLLSRIGNGLARLVRLNRPATGIAITFP